MKPSPLQNITPAGYFSLQECEKMSGLAGFEEAAEIVKESFEHLKAKYNAMMMHGEEMDGTSPEYHLGATLGNLNASLSLIHGLPRYEVAVLNKPHLLFHMETSPTAKLIVNKPDLESYNPIRHLGARKDSSAEGYEAPTAFFDKQTYLELPDPVSLFQLSSSALARDYNLDRNEFKAFISTVEQLYWETDLKDDPAYKKLSIALDFLTGKTMQKFMDGQGHSEGVSLN